MEKERTVKINSSTDLVINDVITFLRKKFPYKKFSKKGVVDNAVRIYVNELKEKLTIKN